jgi:serine/threonine protein kinase
VTVPLVAGYSDLVLVGGGGLGDVYRAVRVSTGGPVAIKVVREVGDMEATERRVLRELEALLKLKGHPNVVQVEEVIKRGTILALVMEFVSGGTLMDLLQRNGPLSSAQALIALTEVARALNDAHALGVVHRDIKPHNVMVSQFGQCKVCDFGIAALAKDTGYTDRTNALSYRYASPEEIDDEPEIGPPADVYSLGVSLRQLLTGETNPDRARMVSSTLDNEPAQRDLRTRLSRLADEMTARVALARPTASQVLNRAQEFDHELGVHGRAATVLDGRSRDNVRTPNDDAPTVIRPERSRPWPPPGSGEASSDQPRPGTPNELPDPSSSATNWWE